MQLSVLYFLPHSAVRGGSTDQLAKAFLCARTLLLIIFHVQALKSAIPWTVPCHIHAHQVAKFLIISLLFPLLLWLFSARLRTRVFLDSCCVVQHDPAQKAAGIASIGAIVSRSERLLVLVDEHTFTRVHAQAHPT